MTRDKLEASLKSLHDARHEIDAMLEPSKDRFDALDKVTRARVALSEAIVATREAFAAHGVRST